MASSVMTKTLVNIAASYWSHAVAFVAGKTLAIPRSNRINASCHLVASTSIHCALVDVGAILAVAGETGVADTLESAGKVHAPEISLVVKITF